MPTLHPLYESALMQLCGHSAGEEEETARREKQENSQALYSWYLRIVVISGIHAYTGPTLDN